MYSEHSVMSKFLHYFILKMQLKLEYNSESESESFIDKLRQTVFAIHTTKIMTDMKDRKENIHKYINMMVIHNY